MKEQKLEELYGFNKEEAEQLKEQNEEITPTLDITQLEKGDVLVFTPINEPETITKKDDTKALIVKVDYKGMPHTLWLTGVSIRQAMYKINEKHEKITGLKLALTTTTYTHKKLKKETKAYRITEAL